MAVDSEARALKPAMDARQIKREITRSETLNESAWQRAEELGPDSPLFDKAEKHWKRLLSFQIPEEPEDRDAFEHATYLAWWACWRARDYTFQRIHEHVRQMTLEQRRQWEDTERFAITVAGVKWPLSHLPIPYLNDDEYQQVESQLDRINGTNVAYAIRNSAIVYSEGLILNSFGAKGEKVSWHANWRADWCYIDKHTQHLNLLENSYLSSSAGAPAAQIKGGSKTSVFRCPVELIGLNRETDIQRSRFSSGVTIKNLQSDDTFNVPHSVETGPYLSFSGGRKNLRVKIENAPGVREIRTADLGDGHLNISEQKLRSLKLLSSSDDNRLALCWLQNSVIGTLYLNGGCAYRLKVQNSRFQERVEANGSTLNSVHLEGSEFLETECCFDGRSVILNHGLFARGCTFKGDVDLTDSTVGKFAFSVSVELQRNTFQKAFIAKSTVDDSRKTLGTIDVRNSDFLGEVTFENRTFRARTAFEDCVFHRAPRFHSCEFNFDTSFRRTEFDWMPYVSAKKGRERDDRLSVTEGSFRTLAKEMETIKAHDYQSKFHVEQMRARFKRKDGGEVPFWDRVFAAAYGIFAAFGSSFVLPFLWLMIVLIIATIGYVGLGYFSDLPTSTTMVTSAFALGLTLTFRPFFVFNPLFGRAGMDACANGEQVCGSTQLAAYLTQNCEIGFKLIGLVHSVFSTLFIFLILLSLRRKFQLS